MVERVSIRWRRLVEVRVLHHYWLDEGAVPFDRIAGAGRRAARLAAYDRRAFLRLAPTPACGRLIAGLRGAYLDTPLGFVVAVPEAATLPADLRLDFVLTPAAGSFFDYTALTLRPQTIHVAQDPATGRIRRFKENLPLLSNLTGTRRGVGADARLYLSRPIPAPAASDRVEALVAVGGALRQLTSDNPGATSRELAADVAGEPVYLHQADAPAIASAPPGAPARGLELGPDVPDDAFALIRLAAVRGDDDAFSLVDAAGAPRAVGPVFEVRLKNRSTVWTYLDKRSGAPVTATPGALPLTRFGNAGDRQKPGGPVKAVLSGQAVTRLVSEIYV